MTRLRSGWHVWLLLALALFWPLAAAGHGPGHDKVTGKHLAPPATGDAPRQAVPQAKDGEVAQPGSSLSPEPSSTGAVQPAPAPSREPEAVDPGQWVREKAGEIIPLDTIFKNERGETVTLGQLIDRPTLLLPIYYRCPTGCSFELANLAEALRRSRHPVDEFRVLSLSFDEAETPAVAAEVRPNFIEMLPKAFPKDAWVFLTGDRENIRRLTDAIGFTFQKKNDGTFVHASALIALDKEGRIIKYIYGTFIPGDVDLALAEAAKGTPVTSIRRLLAFCLPGNPRQNQQVLTYLKIGSGSMLLVGGVWFLLFLRRKKSDQPHFKP